MAEEQRGSRGKSYGNHKSYGSGKPGDRGGKGFKPANRAASPMNAKLRIIFFFIQFPF